MGKIAAGVQSLIIGLVTNPTAVSQSSNFRITTLYSDVAIDRNEVYGIVSFASAPKLLSYYEVQSVTNTKVLEGSSWKFMFKVQKNYTEGMTLRFTFPDGFVTGETMCNVD